MLFTPAGLGPETGALIILSNDKLHPSVTVNLQAPASRACRRSRSPRSWNAESSSMTFGTVGIGVPGKTSTLKIHNIGLGKLAGNVGRIGRLRSRLPPAGRIRANRARRGADRESAVHADRCWTGADDADDHHRQPGAVEATLLVPISGSGAPGDLATKSRRCSKTRSRLAVFRKTGRRNP